MRSEKMREVFSKIDTDISMDHRIKNQIIYYDINEGESNYLNESIYGKRSKKTYFFKSIIIRPIISSVVTILLMIVVLVGFRANIFHKTDIEHNKIDTSTTQPDLINGYCSDTKGDDTDTSEKQNSVDTKKDSTNISEMLDVSEGRLDSGIFDVVSEGNIKTSIPRLILRLRGHMDIINPDDLSEVVLTRDGKPVDNKLYYSGEYLQFNKWEEDFTDFYFNFDTINILPGIYGLTGKYKGNEFTVYQKSIEREVTEEPANPEDLECVSWLFYTNEGDQVDRISELVFYFDGFQNAFYQSDLSDMKILLNGNEIPFTLEDRVFRYYEMNEDNTGDTSFNLLLDDELVEPGTYVMNGVYSGKAFTSMEITIP